MPHRSSTRPRSRFRPACLASYVVPVAAALALATSGCWKQLTLESQIDGIRTGAPTLETWSDYEGAEAATFAQLAEVERLHYAVPDNDDALLLLSEGWAKATFAFI